MPIRIRVTLFDPGANGAPTTNNPHTLRNLDSYEHTIVNEGGFESLQVSFRVATRAAAQAYLDRLMCGVVATSPRGRKIWEGFVQEVSIEAQGHTTTMSLADMANQIVVRYKDASGAQISGAPISDAVSIARYGTKTRLINFATATAAAATNRAGVILKQIGSPRSKQKRSAGSGKAEAGYTVTITARGWWDALAWLLTASTSTTQTVTSTQALTLITNYNATNNFFSVDTTNVVATGVSDTETIEPDTTYQDAIATKLASGDSTQQRVVYGCYEDRRITIRPWAYANPSSYAYIQRSGDATIRDAYGSIVPIWDVRPDAIVLLPDLTLPASTTTALDRADRMYLRRVRIKLGRADESIELEPDDADSIEELLTRPNGSGVAGTSARQAAIERVVAGQAQTRFSGTNGKVDLGGGSITAPGGVVTITPPGGAPTTLPTGGGSALTGSGTAGQLAKWSGATALTDAVAGTDYVAPAALNESIDDRVAALLVAGAGIGVSYNDTANTLTISNTGGTIGGTGTAGRIMQWATGGANAEDSTLIKSGVGVLTLSAASTLTLTLSGGSATLDFSTPTNGDVLQYDGTKFTPTALAAGAPTNATYITQTSNGTLTNEQALASLATGMLKVTTTTGVLSSVAGTSGRITEWSDATTIGTSTLIKSGAGVLTLSAGGTYTLTVPATGTAVLGTGSADRIPLWSGTNTLTSDAGLTYDTGTDLMTLTGKMEVNAPTGAATLSVKSTLGSTKGTLALYVENNANFGCFVVYNDGTINAGNVLEIQSTKVVDVRKTGWALPTGTLSRATFDQSTVTLAQLAQRVAALVTDFYSHHGLIGA